MGDNSHFPLPHPQASDPAPGLVFPQVARLELDELLEQLVARARDVQDTQGRLRGLLRAYLAVGRAEELDQVLRHMVEAARELVNAQYAALGVVVGGGLVRFLHTGMEPELVARIGQLPEGKGVLGALVDYPQTLRLADIAAHATSVGFPDGHPPMRSFLGVPVRIGDRVFGNLYLADKQGAAEFTGDDEELVLALAAAAGTAIENATLLSESRRRQGWQAAMVEVTTGLLGGTDPDEALRQFVRYAMETLGASGAGVSVPTDDSAVWRMAVTEGTYRPWQDDPVPLAGSVSGAAVESRGLVLVPDGRTDPRTAAATPQGTGVIGETVAVAMIGDGGVTGVLLASRRPGEPALDQLDRDMISAIAAQAGLALELAGVRRDNERLRLVEDRQQIAEDLRHRAIRRLFSHGLALQSTAARVTNPAVRAAIDTQIIEVDAVIRDIREAVFSLSPTTEEPDPEGRPEVAPT
jgi:GAF domain-containing protein